MLVSEKEGLIISNENIFIADCSFMPQQFSEIDKKQNEAERKGDEMVMLCFPMKIMDWWWSSGTSVNHGSLLYHPLSWHTHTLNSQRISVELHKGKQ